MSLLQAVETNLLRNHNEIKSLRTERAAAEDEIQQLKNMLQATLSLSETSTESRPSLPDRDLQSLFNRLNGIVANTNRDFEELFGEPETPAPGSPKRAAKPKKKPRGKGLRKIFS